MSPEVAELFVDALREEIDAGLRLAVEYDADEYEVVFADPEVRDSYTEEEFDEYIKQFVLKAYDDAPHQPEFVRLGHLDATVRWFDDVVAVQIPVDDWDGFLLTFERGGDTTRGEFTDAVLDLADKHLGWAGDAEEPDEQIEAHFDE